MNIFNDLMMGFSVVLLPQNLGYCFVGGLVGTLVGVLPGLGPGTTIAILLPSTYYIEPTSAIIMFSGIYFGAKYGGAITSILVNIPGEGSSVVTCMDGYQMTRQGRAGSALGIAAFGGFIAGTLGVIGLVLAGPPLARVALQFGPPEYSALIFMASSMVIYLGSGSMLKAVITSALGIFVGTIGIDFITGDQRFTYGSWTLSDGIGLIPVIVGLFGIAEVLQNIEKELKGVKIQETKIKGILPSLKDWKDSWCSILRGTLIGFFTGILPGGGPIMASFMSYATEKRISKNPNLFGHGAIQGVAGPESADNAASTSNFIPLLTLGIPTNVVMVILLGALMVHGIRPGPMLITDKPEIFWGLIASMYIANLILLILNVPLIGLWIRIVSIPYRFLFAFILLFCIIGVYSLNSNPWEIIIMVIFGIIGYLMRKFKYEVAPFIFSMVLCPIMETSIRQSLLMSEGRFSIFFARPISCIFMIVGLILFSIPALPWFHRKKVGGI